MTPPTVAAGAQDAPAVLRFVPQAAADLRYYLYPVALDGTAWQVLDRLVVEVCGGHLDLAIIGSSHVLTLRLGGAVLTEVLACLPAAPTAVPPLAMHAACGRWQARAACGPATWTTHFAAQRYPSTGGTKRRAGTDCGRSAPPCCGNSRRDHNPLPPLTAIEYAVAADGAQLTTWHTYPQERAIAVTHTTIALR